MKLWKKNKCIKTIQDETIYVSNEKKLTEDVITESNKFDQSNTKIGYSGKISKTAATWYEEYSTAWKCINEITKTGNSKILWRSHEMAKILRFIRSCNRQIKSTRQWKMEPLFETASTISGLGLTNDNYGEEKNIKGRFGNAQIIISLHMNSLLKLPKVKKKDLQQLR